MSSSLIAFIDNLSNQVAELESKKNAAFFEASITGDDKFFQEYQALEMQYSSLLGREEPFRFLSQAKKMTHFEDPLVRRQVDILYLMHLPHQLPGDLREKIISLESKIEQKFSLFRAVAGDRLLTDNEVEDILESSSQTHEVKDTWEASKMVGPLVEQDVLQLVALRNESARQLGYDNYHQMSLMLSEQDPQELTTLFDKLDELTREAFLTEKESIDTFLAKKFGLHPRDLMPWHYQDRFFQEAPAIYDVAMDGFFEGRNLEEITRQYFTSIGMDISSMIERSDLYEKPGKNQHAYCINIDRHEDIRVLCNLRSTHKWMNTMLHEFGHAVYEKYFMEGLPFFLREPSHIFTTEAVAMFFGRLAGNPSWLQAMGLIDAGKAQEITPSLVKRQRASQLVFSRWVQVMFRFEKALYEDPCQDLNELWWNLAARYQGLNPPENTNFPHWATKIHVATAPCYYHNYLLGELLASQFHHYLVEKELQQTENSVFPSFHGKEAVGRFFREKVFAPGTSLPWDQMIVHATGEPLNPEYYARQFVNSSNT